MKSPLSQVVLNVDDNEGALLAKTRILRRAGFEVLEARDGASALALVAEKSPQLVLLDVELPDISGLDVCRRIKSDAATRRTPVLHISSTPASDVPQRDLGPAPTSSSTVGAIATDAGTSSRTRRGKAPGSRMMSGTCTISR